ncbi:MAG: hypothetical protein U5L75_01295 [Candidatus Campbellbacteria bacterium]|nr:hypothetical protein [Candidatus Campbellbacteria bacterium]
MVSSTPDGEAINSLVIYNEDGEPVDTMNNFVDRFQVFTFPPGDYSVRVFTFTESGSISVTRDVSLFSDESVTIDASGGVVSNVYVDSPEMLTLFLSFPLVFDDTYMDDSLVSFDSAELHVSELHLSEGSFVLTDISSHGLGVQEVVQNGITNTVNFTPADGMLMTGFTSLSFGRPVGRCGRFGHVEARWTSETVTVHEYARMVIPCKG